MTEGIEHKIDTEIEDFKSEIFRKYNVQLHVFFSRSDMMEKSITLEDLWSVFGEWIRKEYPDYVKFISLKLKTRKQIWVTILQCFTYIAFEELEFNKSQIGRFLRKDHATVIHMIKRVKEYQELNDKEFASIYNQLEKEYLEYVGAL